MTPGRSFAGCWTCRLRRKKCDELHPVCVRCSTLQITCHYEAKKPSWMDSGEEQAKMAERVRAQVRDKARERRKNESTNSIHVSTATNVDVNETQAVADEEERTQNEAVRLQCLSQRGIKSSHPAGSKHQEKWNELSRSDMSLISIYMDQLFPALYPQYQPSHKQGGRSWLLELLVKSPVLRKAISCQATYFLEQISQCSSSRKEAPSSTMSQIEEAFAILRTALQVIEDGGIEQHVHGAVRVLSGIIQLQRFESAVMVDASWKIHYRAATSLAIELFDTYKSKSYVQPQTWFETLVADLGPGFSIPGFDLPSAELSVFKFSITSLLMNDILASTTSQDQMRLLTCYTELLSGLNPSIDLELIFGCKNWVFLKLAEISELAHWKRQSIEQSNFDIMKLAGRASKIKESLSDNLSLLEQVEGGISTSRQNSIVTRVWANSTLLYLSIVLSGPQTANREVRNLVRANIALLAEIQPRQYIQTLTWPFFVTGCLAEVHWQPVIRQLVDDLPCNMFFQPLVKALEILATIWKEQAKGRMNWSTLPELLEGKDVVLLI